MTMSLWQVLAIFILAFVEFPHCQADDDCVTIDAAVRWYGRLFLFAGDEYMEIDSDNREIEVKNITDNWIGLPDDLDAAVQYAGDWQYYFFKGDSYYRYSFGSADGPNPISDWDDSFEGGIDAGATREGTSFFAKGDEYISVTSSFLGTNYLTQDMPADMVDDVDAAWDVHNDWETMAILKGNQIYLWGDHITGPYDFDSWYFITSWTLCESSSESD